MAEDTEPQAPLARDRATETAIASERRAENPIPAAIELAHWRPPEPWSRPFTGEKAPSEPVASEVPVLDLSGPPDAHDSPSPNIPPDTDRRRTDLLGLSRRYEPRLSIGSKFGVRRQDVDDGVKLFAKKAEGSSPASIRQFLTEFRCEGGGMMLQQSMWVTLDAGTQIKNNHFRLFHIDPSNNCCC
ncbi:hypothetical protein NW767_003224 [Fusarium falciforme]|nr:hypothetical protein NW767_003224 [Fusarium falciforme]